MKLYRSTSKVFAGLVVVGVLLLSCESSDSGKDVGTRAFVKASFGSGTFESSRDFDSVASSKIESTNSTTLMVQGVDNNGGGIALVIAEYEGVGTYDISFDQSNGSSGTYTTRNTVWSSVSAAEGTGTIIVTEETELEISGNFNFVGVEVDEITTPISITDGVFFAQLDGID